MIILLVNLVIKNDDYVIIFDDYVNIYDDMVLLLLISVRGFDFAADFVR